MAKLSVTNLLVHKSEYKGKRVEVIGYYLSYFECSKLSQHQGDGDEVSIWIHVWRVKPGREKQVKPVAKGQVRVVGTFDYKDTGSGHLGMCAAETSDAVVSARPVHGVSPDEVLLWPVCVLNFAAATFMISVALIDWRGNPSRVLLLRLLDAKQGEKRDA